MNKYHDIGTIVKIKKCNVYIMICGFKSIDSKSKKTYDYLGCIYPMGITKPEQLILFNNNQIEEIVYKGFDDDRGKKFKKILDLIDSGAKNINVSENDYSIDTND